MEKKSWIYQIRGIAIAAVVISHMKNILFDSALISMSLLYSVTILIFLAGVTQVFSIKNAQIGDGKNVLFIWIFGRIFPSLASYSLACFCYMIYYQVWTGNFSDYLNILFAFNITGPMYFMKYYFVLTFLSPLIYTIAEKCISGDNKIRTIMNIVLVGVGLVFLGELAYYIFPSLGVTYLFIYFCGMLFCMQCINIELKMTKLLVFPFWGIMFCIMNQYYNRIREGDNLLRGLEKLIPHAQLNPPNIVCILYSIACFMVFYVLFKGIEKKGKLLRKFSFFIEVLGKYSLDIFLWHVLVLNILEMYWDKMSIPYLTVKRIVYLTLLFGIPILGRIIYTKAKNQILIQFKMIK